MLSENYEYHYCDAFECLSRVKNNRWAVTKASDWFFSRDGKAFCPNHIPAWVAKWREEKARTRDV